MPQTTQSEILHFWFTELTPQQHFTKHAALDESIRTRFGPTLEAAARCELFPWRDHFPKAGWQKSWCWTSSRAMCTATPPAPLPKTRWPLPWRKSWWPAGRAGRLPQGAARVCLHAVLHSESALIHEQALALFAQPGMENNLDFERRHKAIIDRFGRYPHRNAILGRTSTPKS